MIIFGQNVSVIDFTKETLTYSISNFFKFLKAVLPLLLAFTVIEYVLSWAWIQRSSNIVELFYIIVGGTFLMLQTIEGSLHENWNPKNYGFYWSSRTTKIALVNIKLIFLTFLLSFVFSLFFIPLYNKGAPLATDSIAYGIYLFYVLLIFLVLYATSWPAFIAAAAGQKMSLRGAFKITKNYLFRIALLSGVPCLLVGIPCLVLDSFLEGCLLVHNFPLNFLGIFSLWISTAFFIWGTTVPIVFLHKIYLRAKDKKHLEAVN